MNANPAGYSSTPLARKLGISEGCRVYVRGAPFDYVKSLEPLPLGVVFVPGIAESTDLVHVFYERKADLEAALAELRASIRSDAAVWVSWPKKSSKRPTDITEGAIREIALPLGFVDVKVCAVNETWSALKLVVRKALRE